MEIKENYSLKNYNTWKVGGTADFFCLPTSIEEIKSSLKFANEKKLAVTVLGGGSNILVSDAGIRGLCICLKKFVGKEVLELEDRVVVRANAGESKASLLKTFLKYKLPPALMLAGLPGDVGGGIVMNAGVSEKIVPREFVEIVDWIEVLRGDRIEKIDSSSLTWTYRHCDGWQPGIIVGAQFSWNINDMDASIGDKVRELNTLRLQKQPLDKPTCGSVFVNPKPHSSGRLIEESGLKGFRVGGAQVSDKHANFIVNTGEASAEDIHKLISHIQKTVFEKKNISLNTEVKYIGDWT